MKKALSEWRANQMLLKLSTFNNYAFNPSSLLIAVILGSFYVDDGGEIILFTVNLISTQ